MFPFDDVIIKNLPIFEFKLSFEKIFYITRALKVEHEFIINPNICITNIYPLALVEKTPLNCITVNNETIQEMLPFADMGRTRHACMEIAH